MRYFVGESADLNLYTYVLNNPLHLRSSRFSFSEWRALAAEFLNGQAKRFQDTRRFMVLTLRMDEVKLPTLRRARAKRSLRCGALRNVVLDWDRMSMTTRLPMQPVVTTASKQGKAKAADTVPCLQMNTQRCRRSNSDDKES